MTLSLGYTLPSEEHPPSELVALGRRAEEHRFDYLSISDHLHPWVDAQGHSPFVWSVLGALAQCTERVEVAGAGPVRAHTVRQRRRPVVVPGEGRGVTADGPARATVGGHDRSPTVRP